MTIALEAAPSSPCALFPALRGHLALCSTRTRARLLRARALGPSASDLGPAFGIGPFWAVHHCGALWRQHRASCWEHNRCGNRFGVLSPGRCWAPAVPTLVLMLRLLSRKEAHGAGTKPGHAALARTHTCMARVHAPRTRARARMVSPLGESMFVCVRVCARRCTRCCACVRCCVCMRRCLDGAERFMDASHECAPHQT